MDGNYEDIIGYNLTECKNSIANLRSELDVLVNTSNELVEKLTSFQDINHDVDGSAISEDYKDLAVIFGTEGFNGYIDKVEQVINDVEQTVNDWEKALNP